MFPDADQDDRQPRRLFALNGFWIMVLASLTWLLIAGQFVSERHAVDSLAAYKAEYSNFAACGGASDGADLSMVNACMEAGHAARLDLWRQDAGRIIVLPPTLAWLAFSLLGPFRGMLIPSRRRA